MIVNNLFIVVSLLFSFLSLPLASNFSIEECTSQDENISTEAAQDPVTPILETPFSGSSTLIYINYTCNSSLNYPGQKKYFDFYTINTGYITLGYQGPSSHIKLYYYSYFDTNNYLTHTSNTSQEPDIYYVDSNCHYLLEVYSYSISYSTSISFLPSYLTSSMTNLDKYALHVVFDTSSDFGNHRNVEYFDVSDSVYTPIQPNVVSNSTSITYLDLIDSTHNFHENGQTWTDNRRLVYNTDYRENSSVGRATARLGPTVTYNCTDTYWVDNYIVSNGSATFVSETTAISCAHLFYSSRTDYSGLSASALIKSVNIYPGRNSYVYLDSISEFGSYKATEAYVSIGYIMVPSTHQTSYDWSIILTTNTTQGQKTHSSMGIDCLQFYNGDVSNSSTYILGYPSLKQCPENDKTLYSHCQWTSYPRTGTITIYSSSPGTFYTTYHIITNGASGGALYTRSVEIINGNVVVTPMLIGITDAIVATQTQITSYIYRISPTFINIVSEVIV